VRRLRRRLWLERAFFLLVMAAMLAYHYGAVPGIGKRVCLVAVDGHPVAVVGTRAEAERLLKEIGRSAGPVEKVRFAQKVTFHSVAAEGNPVQPEAKAMEALASRLQPVMEGAVILANGQVVVVLGSKAEAAKTLSRLLSEFAPAGTGFRTVFKEDVKIEMREAPADRFAASAEAAVERIREETAPASVHEVRPGETAWKIALEAHVSVTRLAQANPGMDTNKLRAGDQIKIPGKAAPITVIAQKETQEPIGEGARRRLQVVRVTYENGAQVSREVIGYRRIVAPGNSPARRPEGE
jgi:LysM repeat protein